jgi:acyl-CoA reductase-like NAD-dependent aldehyde dehydrogenase
MATQPEIDKISFTGSTAVGKRVVLALGRQSNAIVVGTPWKSASLVMKDADVQLAVTHLAHGVFRATGQMCTAASRIFVHSCLADEFVDHS